MNDQFRIDEKRRAFRQKYSGVIYNSRLNTFAVCAIFICSLIFSGARFSWNIGTSAGLVLGFLYSETIMYVSHRWQQHRRVRFLGALFEMHSKWHHGMFSNEKMNVDSFVDMNMVILPFPIHLLVLAIGCVPVAAFVDTSFDSDIGWIFMFAITCHLIWYELVHTVSHTKNPKILKRLALHHREHHNPTLMGNWNFGIATTLVDRLFRTLHEKPTTTGESENIGTPPLQ